MFQGLGQQIKDLLILNSKNQSQNSKQIQKVEWLSIVESMLSNTHYFILPNTATNIMLFIDADLPRVLVLHLRYETQWMVIVLYLFRVHTFGHNRECVMLDTCAPGPCINGVLNLDAGMALRSQGHTKRSGTTRLAYFSPNLLKLFLPQVSC